jgi:hypothetical protein
MTCGCDAIDHDNVSSLFLKMNRRKNEILAATSAIKFMRLPNRQPERARVKWPAREIKNIKAKAGD